MKNKLNFGERMKLLKKQRKEEALKDVAPPKEKSDINANVPLKRIEATEPTYSSKMEENTSTGAALDKALNSIRARINKA